MVQPRGIEPLSTVLQTAAMTTSAKVAKLVLLPRIKLGFRPYQGRVLSLYDKSKVNTQFILLYSVCHGEIEFVSSSTHIIGTIHLSI
jgi:hypothetical protein